MAKSKYDLNSLLGELEKTQTTENKDFSSDFWKPTIEKGEERAEYVIRFLPNPDTKNSSPWIERHAHMFSFPNGKFIYQPCAKKAGKEDKCYICEEVSKLYATKDPAKESIGAKRYAKPRYYHNVLIIKDPRDGGKNEGKVMIYESGAQVHDKCLEFLRNEDLNAAERIYFHPTEGTDFKLVLTWKSNYQNYEKSDFARRTSPITVDGEDLDMEAAEEWIEKNAKGLNERLLGDKVFKDYETLKDLYLNQGVATKSSAPSNSEGKEEEEIEEDDDVTIAGDEVKERNPTSRVEPEENDDDDDDTNFVEEGEPEDDDAELEELLK